MLKKIGLGLLVIAGAFVGVVATRPGQFKIERSATVAAPPEVVQGYVQDFHQWGQWSPWEKLDPNMKRSFAGAASGLGAQYSWDGEKAGAGRMTIESLQPGQSVAIKLEFLKPMAATNAAVFAFKPSGAATEVTWTMTGENNFVGKAFGLVMDMDKLVGKDFEAGLASLKTLAEADARKRAEAPAQPKAAVASAAPAP